MFDCTVNISCSCSGELQCTPEKIKSREAAIAMYTRGTKMLPAEMVMYAGGIKMAAGGNRDVRRRYPGQQRKNAVWDTYPF